MSLFFTHVGSGLKTSDGGDVRGVQILVNGQWSTPSKVEVSGCGLRISDDRDFTEIRYYGVTSHVYEENLNLCNSEGVPMAAFHVILNVD